MEKMMEIADRQPMQALRSRAAYLENITILNALEESFEGYVEKYKEDFPDSEEAKDMDDKDKSMLTKVQSALIILAYLYEKDNGMWLSSVYKNPDEETENISPLIRYDTRLFKGVSIIQKSVFVAMNTAPSYRNVNLFLEIVDFPEEIEGTVLKPGIRDIVRETMDKWERDLKSNIMSEITNTILAITLGIVSGQKISINKINRRIRDMITHSFITTVKRLYYDVAIEAGFKYFMYHTQEDNKVRPSHAELNDMVFDVMDIPWDKLLEPNCRCSLEAVPTPRDYNV